MGELVCILAGFVRNPYVSVSATVSCYSMFEILLMFSVGLANSVNIRVGKYIGFGSVYYAKRVCKIAVLLDVIILTVISVVCILFKDDLPKIYSNDEDVIIMASKLMYFVVVILIGFSSFRVLSGVFQGLGYPEIVAIIMFVTQDVVGLGLTLVLLFAVGLRSYMEYGLYVIWSCTSLGYYLGGIIVGFVLFWRRKSIWIDATNDSKSRIGKQIIDQKNTGKNENNYGSIN